MKKYVRISDLGEIITGKTPPTEKQEYWDGDIPFITPTDIKTFDVRYIGNTERKLSLDAISANKAKKLPKNTICLTCIGSTIGKICLTSSESTTNQQINALIVDSEKYNYNYIYYLFRYLLPYFKLIGSGTGSGKDILNATKFKKMKIMIETDIKEQEKIATLLSKYDELIEINNKKVESLELLINEIYKKWIINYQVPDYKVNTVKMVNPKKWIVGNKKEMPIPEKWEIGCLSTIGKFLRGKNITAENMIDGDVPVISAGINPSGYHNVANVFGNSLTMSASGANAGYLKYNLNDIWAADCSYLQGDNIWFIYSSLNYIKSAILNLQVGSAQPHVYPKNINKMNIIIPEKEIIKKYEKLVSPMFESIGLLQSENKILSTQRDMLIQRLMCDKIEI